jgi:hypothetical protein
MTDTVTYDDLIDNHRIATDKQIDEIVKEMAKVGYDAMYDDGWMHLPRHSDERIIWIKTMRKVMEYLISISEDPL